MTSAGNVAAIDCGSLSTRLLICNSSGATLTRLMRLTGLGRGVGSVGSLSEEAVGRVLVALREFRGLMESHSVARSVMVGTSAVRDAANRADFARRAACVVGTELRLLTGEEEAVLSFAGATRELGFRGQPLTGGLGGGAPGRSMGGPWLVADIGGGSTELAVGPPVAACSLDLGCVRVTEQFFLHDPPSQREMGAARSWLSRQFAAARLRQPALAGAACLVGLAGTVAALACFDQGLTAYSRDAVHHYVLKRQAVADALASLAGEPASLRAGRPGIEGPRAPFIVGGALILDTLMGCFGFEDCLVSESDLLDGLVGLLLEGGGPAWPALH